MASHRLTRIGILVPALLGSLLALAAPGWAASPAAYCRRVGTDDATRPIPQSLVPAATRLFGLRHMKPEWVRRSTLYRCDRHRVLVCNLGANLPCGKADLRRHLIGADNWCKMHRDATFIPLYVTGHDTIYDWRCTDARAMATRQTYHVDRRGFVSEMWKRAD
jgi:hypothetical protein